MFTNVINPRSEVERRDAFAPTHLGDGASVGANATILCGINVGRYAFVGAGAVVLKDVPDFAIMVGNPAVQNGWMSAHGCRLDFVDGKGTCSESGEEYELVVDSEGVEKVKRV